MSLHIDKLLLTTVDVEDPNTAQATLVMAKNHYMTAGLLQQVENALGSKENFMAYLRALDARHLYGPAIYELLVGKFGGSFGSEMFDYVYDELPCQVCGEQKKFEIIMDSYELMMRSQMFFAGKFTPGIRLSVPAIDHFGFGELRDIFDLRKAFEPHWQLNVHTYSRVPITFHRLIQPELPPTPQNLVMVANQEEEPSLKSRHGMVNKR